ncbi:MAG: response regulator [Spirochaetaceae bacterium]
MGNNSDKLVSSKPMTPIGVLKNGRTVKVVVIDDTFIDRRIMSQILKSTGFEVIGEAEDGAEGIFMIENELPHLVLLDYIMPKMDGMAVLKQLKKKYPSVHVIMVTSESDTEIVLELINSGAKDYIVKPLDRKLILEKLKLVVDKLNKATKRKSFS